MKKRVIVILLLLAAAAAFIGFAYAAQEPRIAGSYVYEKDGFGGDFTITIQEDGTYHYYEGMLSSYLGMGTWKQEGSTLILSDDTGTGFVNCFQVDGSCLVFQEEPSDNFLYITVADGARFERADH